MGDKVAIKNQDLILKVSPNVDPKAWDEGKYYQFVDRLCGNREYQKKAIFEALRYLLAGEYQNQEQLAIENWQNGKNEALSAKFQTFENFKNALSFPEKLAASLDLATGTGKSYAMYGIASIMLAEGKIDQVLVLCPSTTIETGLSEKFRDLATNTELTSLLGVPSPKIISGSESVVAGSICIENYHQILANATSSIRDSLRNKGARTLVLNDETHHVYNNENGDPAKPETLKKWKTFLDSEEFNFKYIIGVSGTCYIKDDYFPDVIYRYSLKQAIEDGYVKSVQYVPKADSPRDDNQRWQVIYNKHQEKVDELKGINIRPITIVIAQKITSCNKIADGFKEFLRESEGLSDEQIAEKVLVVHGKSKENFRLSGIDNPESKIEWVFSVSMLTEGWDVKRVFQIVPHEERAFNSKLLIAQVMGRGLRVPENWPAQAGQPKVIVFNHEAWASSVENLVNDVLEFEKKITSRVITGSQYNMKLLNVVYTNESSEKTVEKTGTYNLFEKGYIDLVTDTAVEKVFVEFADLVSSNSAGQKWQTEVKNKTYSIEEMAQVMFERLGEEDELAEEYQKEFPIERLEKIIKKSLKKVGNNVITDKSRQKFLQSLGTIKRGKAKIVTMVSKPDKFVEIETANKSYYGTVSASSLHKDKYIFYTGETASNVFEEEKEFYEEILDPINKFGPIPVMNIYDFKTPMNFVIADSNNEQKFVNMLTQSDSAKAIDKWVKSSSHGLYGIEYNWRKGNHPKNGSFNPDFFILIGDRVIVAEVKGDEQCFDPDAENRGKNKSALKHFEIINEELSRRQETTRYKFLFITPRDFGAFFEVLKSKDTQRIDRFRSELDTVLGRYSSDGEQ